MEDFIQLACHVLTGPTSTRQSVAVWALSMITTEATNREPQRVVTGATAAITATDHITAYPGGGASKKNHDGRKPIFATRLRQPSEATENTELARDFDDRCIAVAVPCAAFLGFLRPPKRG